MQDIMKIQRISNKETVKYRGLWKIYARCWNPPFPIKLWGDCTAERKIQSPAESNALLTSIESELAEYEAEFTVNDLSDFIEKCESDHSELCTIAIAKSHNDNFTWFLSTEHWRIGCDPKGLNLEPYISAEDVP